MHALYIAKSDAILWLALPFLTFCISKILHDSYRLHLRATPNAHFVHENDKGAIVSKKFATHKADSRKTFSPTR